jgi:gamma-glutamyltranspeptidase/glutathione hydrolase
MKESGIDNLEHYSDNAEALYKFIKISRVGWFLSHYPWAIEVLESIYPGRSFSNESQLTRDTAQFLWERIESRDWDWLERACVEYYWPQNSEFKNNHSGAVLAIDENGNVASVSHTINTRLWGETGIFIDGVSIPDSAYGHRQVIHYLGPGNYKPDTMAPCLVLKDGVPYLASGAVGYSLREITIQYLHNILHHGLTLKESLNKSMFYGPDIFFDIYSQNVTRGTFSGSIIDQVRSMGQGISLRNDSDRYWIGLLINPGTGLWGITGSSLRQGYAVGY